MDWEYFFEKLDEFIIAVCMPQLIEDDDE